MNASLQFDIPSECGHIVFDDDQFGFVCECGEMLLLDRVLIEKLRKENALPVVEHIIKRKVVPFLQEHLQCGEEMVLTA